MFRSTPCGRDGVACGSSPFAMRSVQSAKYLIGAAPISFTSVLNIDSPDCPDWMRRNQPSSAFANLSYGYGTLAGNVRVESWPIWWQPTQPFDFSELSQSLRESFAGILLLP